MNEIPTHASRGPARRLAIVALLLLAYAGVTVLLFVRYAPERAAVAGAPPSPPPRDVAVSGERFLVAGAPFHVAGVGWDPARPGELPWTRPFDAAVVEDDFRRIRAAGFNTIRTWAALSAEELAAAERHGLRVLQGIWTPPDADFRDPALRRRVLGEVRRAVETTRWSPAVLGYLVMNEPRASAVARAGVGETVAFLREIAAVVRALDPHAPVGFASWPGLEAVDDPLFDFVAFNVYPHRPRVVMDELGLVGYVRLLRQTVARGRPLVISEFGVSVSPQAADGRGGVSEEEQARELVALADTFDQAGVAGSVVFQWNDGWWKNGEREGDELDHDPADPEEWFGVLRFDGAADRVGAARPALSALAARHRGVVLEPLAGHAAGFSAPVRVMAADDAVVLASVNGGAAAPLSVRRAGPFLEGALPLPHTSDRIHVELEVRTAAGETAGRVARLLRVGAPGAGLAIAPAARAVRPGSRFVVEVRAPSARSVSVAAFTEDRYNEDRRSVRPRRGLARVEFVAPPEETILSIVAFEDDPSLPPGERAVARAFVEVRR